MARGGDRKTGMTNTTNTIKYSHLCDWCGAVFKSTRPDACYCKSTCRASAHKKRKAAQMMLEAKAEHDKAVANRQREESKKLRRQGGHTK